MTEPALPPVQGEGLRNGATPKDIPDGYISWEEHYEAWREYHKHHRGQDAENIANRGGFGYGELKEFLGHNPVSWMPRDLVKYAAFVRQEEDQPTDEEIDYLPASKLRSHICFTSTGQSICKIPDAAPDEPFNFDTADAAHCSSCLRKLHNWVAGWINHGRNAI